MPSPRLTHIAALALLCLLPTARAQAPEAAVQRIQIQDDEVLIDELRVRGVTRQLRVKPKIEGVPAYEIQPHDPARDPSAQRGESGRRVWRVLSF